MAGHVLVFSDGLWAAWNSDTPGIRICWILGRWLVPSIQGFSLYPGVCFVSRGFDNIDWLWSLVPDSLHGLWWPMKQGMVTCHGGHFPVRPAWHFFSFGKRLANGWCRGRATTGNHFPTAIRNISVNGGTTIPIDTKIKKHSPSTNNNPRKNAKDKTTKKETPEEVMPKNMSFFPKKGGKGPTGRNNFSKPLQSLQVPSCGALSKLRGVDFRAARLESGANQSENASLQWGSFFFFLGGGKVFELLWWSVVPRKLVFLDFFWSLVDFLEPLQKHLPKQLSRLFLISNSKSPCHKATLLNHGRWVWEARIQRVSCQRFHSFEARLETSLDFYRWAAASLCPSLRGARRRRSNYSFYTLWRNMGVVNAPV